VIELSDNARKIFKDLYCFQGETIEDTFKRVAKDYGKDEEEEKIAFELLSEGIWRVNTPAFLNAGTKHKVFSACYVVGLEDSMDSIYNVANVARKIFQFGSGIGIPIGNLREKDSYIYEGDREKPPEGQSSGPLSFMKLYDAVGETTKSGGRVRRAAILCALPCWHPDVKDFINCKEIDGRLANMNISVLITDKFMQALKDRTTFDLLTPVDGSKVGEIDPLELWNRLADMAHKSAEPGVIFIDNVNKYNPLAKDILIETCNPCGEQFLIPFQCCNLSAINLFKFVKKNGTFDWKKLYNTVKIIAKLMDNTIDIMAYPDPRFEENAIKYRPIGVGPMGLADALFALDLKYDGQDGRRFASDAMRTITTACVDASTELAKVHGTFYNYDRYRDDMERILSEHMSGDSNEERVMAKVRKYGTRNSQFSTAMPTGTTALSCDASYGIEPMMGLVFKKNLISGEVMNIANPVFENRFKRAEWYSDTLLGKIAGNGGSLKGLHGIPKEVRDVFVVAHDIGYKSRIDMQSELQRKCSTAISSTINLDKDTEKAEVADLFRYAYEKGLKGVTIYRDGSKKGQPVSFSNGHVVEEFHRPNRMNAENFIVETGNGKMYVTISDDHGKPVEVFLFLGKSGQMLNTFTEAIGRVISLALQSGVPISKLTKTLRGINSDSPVWHKFEPTDLKPTQILSIPDGVAKLLDKYYLGVRDFSNGGSSDQVCPKCGLNMSATEGCFSCSCGYSKCS